MYKLNQENVVFGQCDWSGRCPLGRTDRKIKKSKQKADHGESQMPGEI